MTRANTHERQRAELFAELADMVFREAEKAGVARDVAQRIGTATCDSVADAFGGTLLYIPVDYARRLAERDAEILRLTETQPIGDIARSFKLSTATVYKILQRAAARFRGAP